MHDHKHCSDTKLIPGEIPPHCQAADFHPPLILAELSQEGSGRIPPTPLGFGALLSLLSDRAGLGAHPDGIPAASALGVLHITGHGERESHTPGHQNSLFQLKSCFGTFVEMVRICTNITGSIIWFHSIKIYFPARMQWLLLFPWYSMAHACQEHLTHIGNLLFFPCQLEISGHETLIRMFSINVLLCREQIQQGFADIFQSLGYRISSKNQWEEISWPSWEDHEGFIIRTCTGWV